MTGEWMKPGIWRRLCLRSGNLEGCCDCGLVHFIEYKLVRGRLYHRVCRAEKVTKQGRRKYARKFPLLQRAK